MSKRYTFTTVKTYRGLPTIGMTNYTAERIGRPFILLFFGSIIGEVLAFYSGLPSQYTSFATLGVTRQLLGVLCLIFAVTVVSYYAFIKRAIYDGFTKFNFWSTIDEGKMAIITGCLYLLLAFIPIIPPLLVMVGALTPDGLWR